MKTKLILKNELSPGDVLVMTTAIRELQRQFPGRYAVDVRTSCDAIFESSPDIESLDEWDPTVRIIPMEYPLINQSDTRPVHFIEAYGRFLAAQLDLTSLEPREFKPHVFLRQEEREWISQVEEITLEPTRFWIINAGGKSDFTCKIWPRESFQSVVDYFRDRIQFVQIGQGDHLHPPLDGVIDLRGKTDTRQLIRLMYHACGVVTGVSFPMHLAAAVENPPWLTSLRPCIVIAGGREPVAWEQYPGHQFLHTIGALDCCARGGCWKSRVVPLNDSSEGDKSLCCAPVDGCPLCMRMITPEDVIRAIEKFAATNPGIRPRQRRSTTTLPVNGKLAIGNGATVHQRVLLRFDHGLGDAIQLTSVLRHLRREHPSWELHVEAPIGKYTAFRGLAAGAHVPGSELPQVDFDRVFHLGWDEWDRECGSYPATKVEKCLLEVFGLTPRPELAGYSVDVSGRRTAAAESYLSTICSKNGSTFNCVLLHYEGNTSTEQKNLSHDLALLICEQVRSAGYVPIILDWDFRSPLPDGIGIHCPDVHNPLWGGTGTGDAEMIAALIRLSAAFIGIDSGPQKVALAGTTPTLAIWRQHHPMNYACPAAHATHLVPAGHWDLLRGRSPAGEQYFRENYRFVEYDSLAGGITDWIAEHLGGDSGSDGLIPAGSLHVRRDNAEQDMVIVRDVYRQDSYRLDLQPEVIRRARVIVDVGAHIGCFARKAHEMNPAAEIICVEACPENIPALRKNVGEFATVIQAACTYEPGELMLLNAVRPNCESTGGSVVQQRDGLQGNGQAGYQYWEDRRPLAKVTLEEIASSTKAGTIDILKLDCEASEFSILAGTTLLSEIEFIFGEYHGYERWEQLRNERFADWDYGHMHRNGEFGIFHLRNPARVIAQMRPNATMRRALNGASDEFAEMLP